MDTGFEGNPSEINLRPGRHADKMQTTCRQDTEYLVMPHGRGEGVKGTNVAREKLMSTDSSAQARACSVAKMALVLLSAQLTHASVRPAPERSTAQDSQIYGGFQLVSHKVQYANPGLACSPD